MTECVSMSNEDKEISYEPLESDIEEIKETICDLIHDYMEQNILDLRFLAQLPPKNPSSPYNGLEGFIRESTIGAPTGAPIGALIGFTSTFHAYPPSLLSS